MNQTIGQTIETTRQDMQRGATSALALVERALENAETHKDLNALAFLDSEAALHTAHALDADARAGRWRGALHGVPVTVKDLFAVEDMPMQAGTRAPLPAMPEESEAVRRLRAAGAVVLGKTNMHEIALGVTGENVWTGDVKNPVDTSCQAGGSSSGAAVAVATGVGLAALGSDTGGSVRIPASFCGVVGFKPSFGAVPLPGALHLSWTCDHAGPLATTVMDAKLMFEVLSNRTAITRPAVALGDWRFGVPRAWLEGKLSNGVRSRFEVLLQHVRALGCEVVDVSPTHLSESWACYTPIVRAEAAHVHRAALATHPEGFSEAVRGPLMAGLDLNLEVYLAAMQTRNRVAHGLNEVLRGVDALLLPAAPTPAPKRGTQELQLEAGMVSHREAVLGLTLPFSLVGLPTLSLPFASVDGLPVGLQVVAPMHQDTTALEVGLWLEANLPG